MTDALLPLVESVVLSPWLYAVLFALAAVDGFFPIVPSETSVIAAGVFAAAGDSSIPLVIVAAALGAFAGDQIAYAVGRRTVHGSCFAPARALVEAPRSAARSGRSTCAAARSSSPRGTSPERGRRSR